MITEKWIDDRGKSGTNTTNKASEGDFDVIYDESVTVSVKKKDSKILNSTSFKKFK